MKSPYHVAAIIIMAFMTSYGFGEPDDDRPSIGLEGDFLESSIETMTPRIKPAGFKLDEGPKFEPHENYPNPF